MKVTTLILAHFEALLKMAGSILLFEDIGKELPTIWNNQNLSRKQRKAFLRCLIDKVVVHRKERDSLEVRIVWKGGETTTTFVTIRVNCFKQLSFAKDMEEQIITLSEQGKKDNSIAQRLTKQGYRSPMKSYVLPSTVQIIRLKHRLLKKQYQSHPLYKEGFLSVAQVAEKLGVEKHWVYYRICNGQIKIDKHPTYYGYLFPDKYETMKLLKQLKNGLLHNLDFTKEHQDG